MKRFQEDRLFLFALKFDIFSVFKNLWVYHLPCLVLNDIQHKLKLLRYLKLANAAVQYVRFIA